MSKNAPRALDVIIFSRVSELNTYRKTFQPESIKEISVFSSAANNNSVTAVANSSVITTT